MSNLYFTVVTIGDVQITGVQPKCCHFLFPPVPSIHVLDLAGSDVYKYPNVPEVYRVTGCPIQGGADYSLTSDCPTVGGLTITICGAGFLTAPVAFVDR